jgi:putative ABC transport system substrate-binding protein
MRRREFITLLGSVAAWPLAARAALASEASGQRGDSILRAQQPERMRRIGVLMVQAADDPEGQARLTAFLQGLREFGWTDGRNVRIDARWHAADVDKIRKHAAEFAALAPDVILAAGTPIVA